MNRFFIYGPPGSGKSSVGRVLASATGCRFIDLDAEIEKNAAMTVGEIFRTRGEAAFREMELSAIQNLCGDAIIALGGGALLSPSARKAAENSGKIVCLDCSIDELRKRTGASNARPLLCGDGDRLSKLLESRKSHYASFPLHLDATNLSVNEAAWELQKIFGIYSIKAGGESCTARVGAGIVQDITSAVDCPHCVVVGDSNTFKLYGAQIVESLKKKGIATYGHTIPAGEETKTLETVNGIWKAFLNAGIERTDTVIAVGGGVVGDMTGFAASCWLRGIDWINVPTSLLAMVDSSIGGKTGCDIPDAKNMIGAFHQPVKVFADVGFLHTLEHRELMCGLAEAVKHAIIADPPLAKEIPAFLDAVKKLPDPENAEKAAAFVSRAMAVKIKIVNSDPFEKSGERAKLNLGHTVGHALEIATRFQMKHGEAVAAGMAVEAALAAHRTGSDIDLRIKEVLESAGLPCKMPDGISFEDLIPIMRRDKKNKDGKIGFALPFAFGDVRLARDILP